MTPLHRSLAKATITGWVVAASALIPLGAQAATITLAWDEVVDPTLEGYKLYYDTDSGDPYEGTQAQEGPSPVDIELAELSDPAFPEFSLHWMPSCERFYFAVTAYNASGESPYSGEIRGTPLDPPDPVTLSPAAPGALLVEWEPPEEHDDGSIRFYEIHYDTDSGEPYQGPGSPITVAPTDLTDPANPSYAVSGLSAGTTYYFVVEAVCPGDYGKMSEEVTGVPTGGGAGGGGVGGSATGGTGAFAGSGGTSDGGAFFRPDGEEDEGGCSCRLGPVPRSSGGVVALGMLLCLAGRRRRRRA